MASLFLLARPQLQRRRRTTGWACWSLSGDCESPAGAYPTKGCLDPGAATIPLIYSRFLRDHAGVRACRSKMVIQEKFGMAS